jgi:hypothetical protein
LAYQPPAGSTFLSEQNNHQQSANSTFLSEQISTTTNHQPNEQTGCCDINKSGGWVRSRAVSAKTTLYGTLK